MMADSTHKIRPASTVRAALLLLPLILSAIVYIPSLGGGFVWDDTIHQRENPGRFRSVGDVLSRSFFTIESQGIERTSYYRPLTVVTYLVDEFATGLFVDETTERLDPARARIPRLRTLFFHLAATLAVSLLMRRLLAGHPPWRREWGALAAGLLFGLHPIHVESVAFIAGRADSLATALLLFGLVLALRYLDTGGRGALIAAAACFLGGLLAKEIGVAGVVLLPLACLWIEGSRSRWRPLLAVHAAALAIYIALRFAADLASPELPFSFGPDVFTATAYYLQKLVIPWPQLHFVPDLSGVRLAIPTLAVFAALAALAVRRFRCRPLHLPAVVWLLVTLAPALLNVVYEVSANPVAERFLYMPSVALALVVGGLVARAFAWRRAGKPVLAIVTLLIAAYGYGTWDRSAVWHDDVSLWRDAAAHPQGRSSGDVWYTLGSAYAAEGRAEEAWEARRNAVGSGMRFVSTYKRAAALGFVGAKGFLRALHLYDQDRRTQADDALALALACLRETVRLTDDALGLDNLCRSLLLKEETRRDLDGRFDMDLLDEARRASLAALRLEPDRVETLKLLAIVEGRLAIAYDRLGDAEAARRMQASADARRR